MMHASEEDVEALRIRMLGVKYGAAGGVEEEEEEHDVGVSGVDKMRELDEDEEMVVLSDTQVDKLMKELENDLTNEEQKNLNKLRGALDKMGQKWGLGGARQFSTASRPPEPPGSDQSAQAKGKSKKGGAKAKGGAKGKGKEQAAAKEPRPVTLPGIGTGVGEELWERFRAIQLETRQHAAIKHSDIVKQVVLSRVLFQQREDPRARSFVDPMCGMPNLKAVGRTGAAAHHLWQYLQENRDDSSFYLLDPYARMLAHMNRETRDVDEFVTPSAGQMAQFFLLENDNIFLSDSVKQGVDAHGELLASQRDRRVRVSREAPFEALNTQLPPIARFGVSVVDEQRWTDEHILPQGDFPVEGLKRRMDDKEHELSPGELEAEVARRAALFQGPMSEVLDNTYYDDFGSTVAKRLSRWPLGTHVICMNLTPQPANLNVEPYELTYLLDQLRQVGFRNVVASHAVFSSRKSPWMAREVAPSVGVAVVNPPDMFAEELDATMHQLRLAWTEAVPTLDMIVQSGDMSSTKMDWWRVQNEDLQDATIAQIMPQTVKWPYAPFDTARTEDEVKLRSSVDDRFRREMMRAVADDLDEAALYASNGRAYAREASQRAKWNEILSTGVVPDDPRKWPFGIAERKEHLELLTEAEAPNLFTRDELLKRYDELVRKQESEAQE